MPGLKSKVKELGGHTAVVTGADRGIGLSFSRDLARRGADVVMISHNGELLDEAARTVAAEYGVKTYSLCCDLRDADACDRVVRFVDDNKLSPDILINNAGIFAFQDLTEISEERIVDFLDLHCRTVTLLSRSFARRFAANGGGRILNMGSLSCWTPVPGMSMYAGTKAYIRVMSRVLHYEMRRHGVTVTVACPGGIATTLFGLPENLKKLAVSLKILQTPDRFARKAVNRMLKGRKQYVNGLLNRLGILMVGVSPTFVRMQVQYRLLDKGITR